ncbi:MAG TPA: hypothetical protein VFQ68_36670 [Streptosporangiaceae bacterium]|nr:hypothetical protein [Streptosporangiaceae bacterium]
MACHPVIEQYVADLSARLPGPRRWRAGVLDEIRDSLLEGMHAHRGATGDPAAAALRAVAEHGAADQVARAYAPELAAAWVRRAGLLALGIIPAMAIMWNLALRAGPPSQWQPSGTGLRLAATVIASGVGLTLMCSTAALLGTGRLAASIGGHLPAFRSAICTASIAVSVAVLTLLGVVATRAVTAPGSLEWPAVLAALALSLTALTSVGRTAYRCVTSSHALP